MLADLYYCVSYIFLGFLFSWVFVELLLCNFSNFLKRVISFAFSLVIIFYDDVLKGYHVGNVSFWEYTFFLFPTVKTWGRGSYMVFFPKVVF